MAAMTATFGECYDFHYVQLVTQPSCSGIYFFGSLLYVRALHYILFEISLADNYTSAILCTCSPRSFNTCAWPLVSSTC